MPTPTVLRAGQHFACFAMDAEGAVRFESAVLQVDETRWVCAAPPFVLSDPWPEWLGKIEGEQFSRCTAFVVATEDSPSEVHGAEYARCHARASLLTHALVLIGCVRYSESRVYGGNTATATPARPSIRTTTRLPDRIRHHKDRLRTIDVAALRRATVLADALTSMFADRPTPGDVEPHLRVRRGFNVLMDGLERHSAQDRLHECVRSLEAAIMLTACGKGRAQFRERGAFLFGADQPTDTMLDSLYRLRNCAEHLHGWEGQLTDVQQLGPRRAFEAECLATMAYARMLERPGLLEQFHDDKTTLAFWNLNVAHRRDLWGPVLDVASEVDGRYKALRAQPCETPG